MFAPEETKTVTYKITDTSFKLIKDKDETHLLFTLESSLNQWKEPGSPLYLILTKEKVYTENNVAVSDHTLQLLTTQNSFIKLYPNPFKNDLMIAYTLDQPGHVQVKVQNIDESTSIVVEQGKQQDIGDYIYYFDGSNLNKGIYVVSVQVNTEKKTKLIIKE